MSRRLAIGFGNVYRRDDGVGLLLINALRESVGRPALLDDEDGFDDLGHSVDTLVLHQLVPELAETLSAYDLVVFLDAHMSTFEEGVREEELEVCQKQATVSHQVHPCALLAMSRDFYGKCPRGVLLSVRGYDFEFGEGLSPETAALVPQALQRLRDLMADEP